MKLLFLALCAAAITGAAPIILTTPIPLSGSGTFTSNSIINPGAGAAGFTATGTDGVHTVMIFGQLPIFNDFNGIWADPNAIGKTFSLGGACKALNTVSDATTCGVFIDGIGAFGNIQFTNLGFISMLGGGLAEVSIIGGTCAGCTPGVLLASAEVYDFAVITSLNVPPFPNPPWSGTFDIVGENPVPEPGTYLLCLSGILLGIWRASSLSRS